MIKRKKPKKLKGDELFLNSGGSDMKVSDFWSYAFSNLNSNVLRGALAEFFIEAALKENCEIDIRNPWGDFDILYKEFRIEVKCSSFLQDWDQDILTNVNFTGLKANDLYWSSAVNGKQIQNKENKKYKADIYILSLLAEKSPEKLNILDLKQWRFFILTLNELKKLTNSGNSISLRKLEKNRVKDVSFSEIKNELEKIIKSSKK